MDNLLNDRMLIDGPGHRPCAEAGIRTDLKVHRLFQHPLVQLSVVESVVTMPDTLSTQLVQGLTGKRE